MSETWYCDDHVDLRAAECPMCLTERNAALTLRAEKAEALLREARDLAHEEATQATDWDDDCNCTTHHQKKETAA